MAKTPTWIVDHDSKDEDWSDVSSVPSYASTVPTLPVEPASPRPPLLYQYVMDGLHDLAIGRCRTHPLEAQYRNHSTEYVNDIYGHTALHHACLHGDETPTDLVLALIEAWPEGAEVPNSFGTTPLNHAVCHDAGSDVVKAMLRANVNMVNIDANKGLLWDFALFHKVRIDRLVEQGGPIYRRPPGSCSSVACAASPVHYYQETLRIFKILVQAMCYHSVTESDEDDVLDPDNATSNSATGSKKKKFLVLHSCLALKDCPPSLLHLALSEAQRSNQVQKVDENGDLPLHIAVRNTSLATKSKKGVSYDTDLMSSSSPTSIFPCLIDADPSAVQVPDNKTGKLPLSTALLYNQDWDGCVGPLLSAAPDVLLATPREDTLNQLFVAIAARSQQTPPSDASILDGVLRKCPEIAPLFSLCSDGNLSEEEECREPTRRNLNKAMQGAGTGVNMKVDDSCATLMTNTRRMTEKLSDKSCGTLLRKTRSATKKEAHKNMRKSRAKDHRDNKTRRRGK